MTLLSFNAGGSLNCTEALHSFVVQVSIKYPDWVVCCVQELDFVQSSSKEFELVDGHKVFRHWPGVGSRPMCMIIHRLYRDFVVRSFWHGRAGGIHLFNPSLAPRTLDQCSMIVLNVHGAHGDDLGESLFDATTVVRTLRRRKGSTADVFALGDFNVDLLPLQACDPFCDDGGGRHYNPHRLQLLRSWADSLNVCVCEQPTQVIGVPGGIWSDYCMGAPIFRTPLG